MRLRYAPMALLFVIPLAPSLAAAQWSVSGSPVVQTTGDQVAPVVTSDGSGGAFIAWVDSRSAPYSYDLYVQHLAANGVDLWTEGGVLVCGAPGDQIQPSVVPDGAGGVIVVWEDQRNPEPDIYAQRVSAAGVVQWAANGVAVTTDTTTQIAPRCASDGAGGVLIVWEDLRDQLPDIYGQRLNGSGAAMWAAGGLGICTDFSDQFAPEVIRDGANGAIVTWFDDRNFDLDIYAQRITGAGAASWIADGVPVCVAAGSQQYPKLIPDGAGGALITWEDFRDTITSFDIYAQRINASGLRQWVLNGVSLCADDTDQARPVPVSDGVGGAIVVWQDQRFGDPDLFGQRVSSTGAVQWTVNGVDLCSAVGTQQRLSLATDAAGGAIVGWEDFRSGIYNSEIYAQRVGPTGTIQWGTDGIPITASLGLQTAVGIVADGSGGAIVAWEDARSGIDADIYGQRISSTGQPSLVDVPMGQRPAAFAVRAPSPNPFWAGTTLEMSLASAGPLTVDVFDPSGRRVRTLAAGEWFPAGPRSVEWDRRDERGSIVAAGVYLFQVTSGQGRVARKVTVLP